MALRVLLADESVTIKKVIQLALQDFAVEVKAVPVGLDVLEVSRSFQPDLVFADILLQKRSGYDVCADLKKDAQTAAIPVILMWSSFVELDEKQLESSGADGKLEKPFDVESLRKLVLQLVPRTRSQRLAQYLDFPASVAAPLKEEIKVQAATKPPAKTPAAPAPSAARPPAPTIALSGPVAAQPSPPTGTPVIPARPPSQLGALPDLQLDDPDEKPKAKKGDSGWSMESFDPMDNPALNLGDDEEDEQDAFKPLQLPPMEKTSSPPTLTHFTQSSTHWPAPEETSNKGPQTGSASRAAPYSQANDPLADDDQDADADRWSNRSLEKYRVEPLRPDEELASDDLTPDLSALEERKPTPRTLPAKPHSRTHVITPMMTEDDSEFTMSEEELDRTASLEIEHVEARDKTRPQIVKDLLRDPEFSTPGSIEPPAVDLSSFGAGTGGADTGTPYSRKELRQNAMRDSAFPPSLDRSQIEPALEAAIQRAVAQLLPQLLPEIAERIIKRELDKLLEDSQL